MSESKKWYQRWYVWVIILAILGSLFGDDDKENGTPSDQDSTEQIIDSQKDQNSSKSEISVSNKSVPSSTSDKKAPVVKKKKTRPDCESYSIRSAFTLGMESFAAGTSIDFCSNEIILDGKSYDAELGFINTSSVRYYFNTSWAGEVELLVNFTTNSCIMRMRYEVTERADFRISKSVPSSTSDKKAPVVKKKKTRPDCESYSIRNAFMLGMESFAAGTSIDFCSNEIILDGKSYDAELGFINTSSVRYYFNTSWAGEVELLVNFTTNSCIMRMRYEVTERADFRISKSVSSDTDEEAAAE